MCIRLDRYTFCPGSSDNHLFFSFLPGFIYLDKRSYFFAVVSKMNTGCEKAYVKESRARPIFSIDYANTYLSPCTTQLRILWLVSFSCLYNIFFQQFAMKSCTFIQESVFLSHVNFIRPPLLTLCPQIAATKYGQTYQSHVSAILNAYWACSNATQVSCVMGKPCLYHTNAI